MRQLWKTSSLVVMLIVSSAGARAETPTQAAKEQFRLGWELHDAGNFEEALGHYQRSYALRRDPNVWANIVFCLIDMGEPVKAIAEFDAHVKSDWIGLSEDSRTDLVKYLLDVGKVLGFGLVSIEVAQPGIVLIDAQPQGKIPGRVLLRVLAGPHVVRVEVPEMAAVERDVVVKAGGTSHLTFPLHRLRAVEFFAAMVGGPTLGTNLEQKYAEQATNTQKPALGFNLGARLLLSPHKMFPFHIGLSYLQMHTSLPERMTWMSDDSGTPTVFRIQHALALYGAVLQAGVLARCDIPQGSVDVGLGLGGFIGGYRETGTGQVESNGESPEDASIVKGDRFWVLPVVSSEVRVSQRWKWGDLGISLGVLAVPFGSLPVENPVAAPDKPCPDETRSCAAAAERLSSLAMTDRNLLIHFQERRMMSALLITAGIFVRRRF